MNYKTLVATAHAGMALLLSSHFFPVFAEEPGTTAVNGEHAEIDLSDFDTAPDGVSILALDDEAFKILSIATARYKAATPKALDNARKVAITKAKGAMSNFLNETVSTEEILSSESVKIKAISQDGTISVAQATAKKVISRIKTESKALLIGTTVLRTEKIPDADGPGGSFRVLLGVSSATLKGAEALSSGIDAATR